LALFLKKRGHSVTVLTAMPSYPLNKIFDGYGGVYMKEELDGIDIIRSYIYPSNSVKLISRLFNYFSFVFSSLIVGLFVLPKKDILITESPPLFLGITGYVLSRVKGAKWIFNVSDLWPESAVNLGVIGKGLPLTISFKLEEFFYKKSWLVLGQSKGIVQNINERFPWVDTYLLSNGVDVEKYTPDTKSDILKEWSNDREHTIVYAGLHGIAQGLDQLIKAAKVLDSKLNTLQFVLIGDGPKKKSLIELSRKLEASNVTFVESQPKIAMPEIWASADIAIIPLKQHIPGAVPSKIYEAMASGVPIVMIGVGEPAEIVTRSECGFTVEPNDIIGICDSIKELVNNNKLRKNMSINGRLSASKYSNRLNILTEFNDFIMHKHQNHN